MKTCLSEPFFIHLLCVKVKLLENPAFPTVNLCSVSESWRVRTEGDRRAVWRRKLRPQGWGTHLRSHSQSLTATALRSGSFARIHTHHFSGMTDRRTKVKEFVWIETKVNCLSQTQRPLGKKTTVIKPSYQGRMRGREAQGKPVIRVWREEERGMLLASVVQTHLWCRNGSFS